MNPCGSGCDEEEEEEKDGHIEEEVDIIDTALPETQVVGEEVVEEAHLEEKLTEIVGEHEAENIVEEIIEPIIDTEILQEDIEVDEIVEAIEEVLEQEDITIEDAVPTVEDVVELVNEDVVEKHEEITVIDTPEDLGIPDVDLDNAEIVEIENDLGDVVDVIIIDNPHIDGEGEVVVETDEPEVEVPEPEVEVPEPEVEEPEPEAPEEVEVTGEGEGEGEIVVELPEEIPEEPEVVPEEPEVVPEEPEVVPEEPEVVPEEPEEPEEPEVVTEEPEPEEEEEEEETGGYGDVVVYETTVPEVPALTVEEEDLCDGNVRCALDKILLEAGDRPVVLDFQMDTCPPCQDIAPGFESLKDAYDDVIFFKIDIYEHMGLSMDLGIPGAPAFMFWVNGEPDPVKTVTATSNDELWKVEEELEEVRNMYYDKLAMDGVEETDFAQTSRARGFAQTSRKTNLAQKFSALF